MNANRIQVPGPDVSPTPGFVCTIPTDWVASDSAGVIAEFAPTEASGISDVSVLVSASRVDKTVDLRDIAVRSFAHQRRSHDSVTIDSQRVGRFGDRVVYVRGVTVTDDAPVAQVQGMFFGPAPEGRQTADVFSVVGSCPTDSIAKYGPVFIDILASISFDGVSTSGGGT